MYKIHSGLLALLLVSLGAIGPSGAQDAARVRETVNGNLQIDQAAQAAVSEWALIEPGMRSEYEGLKREARRLQTLLDAETARTGALRDRVAEVERRLQEAVKLESSLQDTMLTIFGRLETAIEKDLRFLPDERDRRMSRLQAEMARAEVSPGEKLRWLLEVLQVEAAYGGSVEVYQADIELDGRMMLADILRLGRLSVFWMSPDGKEAGEFDRVSGTWRPLPDKHRRTIRKAFEMASRTRSMELLDLPLGRLAP